MNPVDNPYNPGAGSPPPELAGRDVVLQQAENSIKRILRSRSAKGQILLCLRGVGKTVLLNRINQIAETEGCQTAIFEAIPDHSLPELLTQQLQRLLLKLDRRKKAGEDIQTAFRMLRNFASAFKVKYGEFEVGLTNKGVTGDLSIDLTDLFVSIGEAAKKRNTAVVLFIDEIQYLSMSDLGALILALHKIMQNELPFHFFGAGLPQIARLTGDAKSYSERLFDFPLIDKLDQESTFLALEKPAELVGVKYTKEALELIHRETEGYPYFIQVWGSHLWEITSSSPIQVKDVKKATERAIRALDAGFYKVRIDRLTDRQKLYVNAMAKCGNLPTRSSDVAKILRISVTKAAPLREELIKKGMVYSPQRGLITFSVPKFRDFLLRNEN
jgi:hypothetical protein